MVTSPTVRAAQKVSREGGAIAVTPAGEARHGCFSHSQGCAEGFKRGMCDSCDIGKQGMVASRTVRAAQKVSREGGAIAVTLWDARHDCFSHSQGCAEGFGEGGAIAVTAGEARHGCFSHCQGCAPVFREEGVIAVTLREMGEARHGCFPHCQACAEGREGRDFNRGFQWKSIQRK